MLAGLGDEISQPFKHVVATRLPSGTRPLDNRSISGYRSWPFLFKAKEKGHVIDSSDNVVNLFERHANILGKLTRGMLQRWAKADRLNLCCSARAQQFMATGLT
jgi:hypothetical protein